MNLPIEAMLFLQEVFAARSLAELNAGIRMPASMAMIAMTTSNSISVKLNFFLLRVHEKRSRRDVDFFIMSSFGFVKFFFIVKLLP